MKKFSISADEIKRFVKDHIQEKINANVLWTIGIDMVNPDNFKREYNVYESALTEGIINGVILAGGEVTGLETKEIVEIENEDI